MTTFREYREQYPELEKLREYADTSDFFFSVHEALDSGRGTPRQAEAAAKAITKKEEFKAERDQRDQALRDAGVTLPTGRVTVTGEVVSAKLKDTDYGSSLKLTIKSDDGYTVWGSAPTPVTVPVGGRDELKGARVSLTATVKPSEPGALFGFYSRPKLVAFEGEPTALALLNSDGKYPSS